MGNKSTSAKLERNSGDVTVHQHETDSPMLPIAHIEKLQSFRPDIVDFIIAETGSEAALRRTETTRHNTRVFFERMAGMVVAGSLAGGGLYAAFALAMAGHEKAAIAISCSAVVAIAAAFLINRRG